MIAAAQNGQEVSSGDTNMYNRASAAALNTTNMIGDLKEEGYSPKEINSIIQDRFNMEQKLAGESPYGALETHIANSKADQANALREARGIGALQAASDVLQPGGTARGLARGAATLGKVYGQAQQADRQEKRALAGMEFNIADAKRKERMGMTKDAIAAANAAQKDKKDAGTARLNKLKAMGEIQAKVATANRPIRIGGGAGGGEKEWAYATKTYLPKIKKQYPDMPADEQNALAYQMYQNNKSPGLPGATLKGDITTGSQSRTMFNDRVQYGSDAKAMAYRKADRAGDAAEANRLKGEIAAEEGYTLPDVSSSGSTKAEPTNKGKAPSKSNW
jgi:hypothetical protein